MSKSTYDRLTTIKVDEDGLKNQGSNHNHLRLNFVTSEDQIGKWNQARLARLPTEKEIELQKLWKSQTAF